VVTARRHAPAREDPRCHARPRKGTCFHLAAWLPRHFGSARRRARHETRPAHRSRPQAGLLWRLCSPGQDGPALQLPTRLTATI